jgi:hypothetical protein
MEGRFVSVFLARRFRPGVPVGGELNGYEMSGYLLGGLSKGTFAVIPEELGAGLIRAVDFKRTAGQSDETQIVKPLSGVDGVKGLRTVQYIRKNIIDFTGCQAMLLYKSVPIHLRLRFRLRLSYAGQVGGQETNREIISTANNILVIRMAEQHHPL